MEGEGRLRRDKLPGMCVLIVLEMADVLLYFHFLFKRFIITNSMCVCVFVFVSVGLCVCVNVAALV